MYERDHLYVGGEWVAPVAGGRIDVGVAGDARRSSGTRPLATACRRRPRGRGGARRVRATARGRAPRPRHAPTCSRAMAEYLRERARPLAELNIDEAGVPITFAHARELGPVAVFGYFEQLTRTFPFREVRQGALAPALVVREPVGVIGAVVPFNGPHHVGGGQDRARARRRAARSCSSPRRRRRSTRSCSPRRPRPPASRPACVNIVPGDADVGAALVAHDGVDRVVFTGQHRRRARDLRRRARDRSSASPSSSAARPPRCCSTTHRSSSRSRRSCRCRSSTAARRASR